MSDSPLGLLVLPPVGWVLAAVWGALWGSFANVAIHRLGLYESVVRPRSRCPRCGNPIAAYDNIPIVSWILLRGRCRRCALPISVRYPLVEALSAGLAVAVYARFVAADAGADPVGLAARFFVYFAFVETLLVISGVDLDHQMIPDAVTYPAIPALFLCALVLNDVPPRDLVIGMVAGYGIVAVPVELIYSLTGRDVMGYGDAKLLTMIGALLGWKAVLFALFGGALLGTLVAVPLRLLQRQKLFGVAVPFGPFIAAGAALYLFFGQLLLGMLTY
jgi:leader peptidase (prepilin peptidase)/N-methyltransferase